MNSEMKSGRQDTAQRRTDYSDKLVLWSSIAAQGVAAGGMALLFLYLIRIVYRNTYVVYAERSIGFFMIASLLLITGTSLISGLLLHFVSPSAAGSGIPEIRIAYWKNQGFVRPKNILVKLVAGVLCIGGGQSLGREGPSIYLGGGFASFLAGRFGTPSRKRRLALLSGSAAGLAAAFNTPLAGVAFVLEEITGELSEKILGVAAFTSLIATFLVHLIIGSHPAFAHLQLETVRWAPYIGIPLVAFITSLLGVFFHRMVIRTRYTFSKRNVVPGWLRPVMGGVITWVIGCSVFAATGRLGVFSMGTHDLDQMLSHLVDWRIAGILAATKILATIACYAFGGCGGIFAPSLFFGGMTGYFTAGLINLFIPLKPSDFVVLALVGMTSCLGAIIRAPLTSFLIIFEMTHHFSLIPALFLGTLISQVITRLFGPYSFYQELLVQDGYQNRFVKPTVALKSWNDLPVSEIANPDPVCIESLSKKEILRLLKNHSFSSFPVRINGRFSGIVSRERMREYTDRGDDLVPEKTETCYGDQTVREIGRLFIKTSQHLLPVLDRNSGRLLGVVTLNDLLRAQAFRTR